MILYAAKKMVSNLDLMKRFQPYMNPSVSSHLGLLHYKAKLAKKAQNLFQIQFSTFDRISEMCKAM